MSKAKPADGGGPVVLALVDALRSDYVDEARAPFLAAARSGPFVERIEPSLGFCERAEIWTGASPAETGLLTAVTLDESLARADSDWPTGLRLLPWTLPRIVDRILRRQADRRRRREGHSLPPYKIPLALLPHCRLTEDAFPHTGKGVFGAESLFDVLGASGRTFRVDAFTALGLANGTDDDRLTLAESSLTEDWDFLAVFLGSLDLTAHRHGTRSEELRRAVKHVDDSLEGFWERLQKKRPGARLVVLGDHGMIDVEHTFDAGAALRSGMRRRGRRRGRDYLYFLDSTMLRVWCRDEPVRLDAEALIGASAFSEHGTALNSEIAHQLEVPAPGADYGHVIWRASPGTLVHPSFFHDQQPPRAMHGYDPSASGQSGCLFIFGSDLPSLTVSRMPLRSLPTLLARLLGVRAPARSSPLPGSWLP